ncbi:hypothetical protein GVAV_002173 [Gurleya vavrai]
MNLNYSKNVIIVFTLVFIQINGKLTSKKNIYALNFKNFKTNVKNHSKLHKKRKNHTNSSLKANYLVSNKKNESHFFDSAYNWAVKDLFGFKKNDNEDKIEAENTPNSINTSIKNTEANDKVTPKPEDFKNEEKTKRTLDQKEKTENNDQKDNVEADNRLPHNETHCPYDDH